MIISINTIKHEDQRYETAGDWRFLLNKDMGITVPGDNQDYLFIKVSELGDGKMNICLAIHELIEALLCKFSEPEVTTEEVDTFDLTHLDLDEPGDLPEAPYHEQHKFALQIERMLAEKLGINWEEYERRIHEL